MMIETTDALIFDFEEAETEQPLWVQIDQWGRVLASRQGEMTLEVCEWLLAARAENVHEAFGHASFAEYAERRLGIELHTLAEKLRVAHALRRLPLLREEFRTGRRHYSAAREISRVAVPETEKEWLEATAGMRAKQVERRVAGHSAGQRPSDRPDPELMSRTLCFEVRAEVYAAWREVVRLERRDVDRDLSEEEILMNLFQSRLRGPSDDPGKSPTGDEGRSNYQVALVQCEDCRRVFQDARGERVELPAEVLERVACDSQHIGRVDQPAESHAGRGEQADAGPSHAGLTKASQSIPPAMRRVGVELRGRAERPGQHGVPRPRGEERCRRRARSVRTGHDGRRPASRGAAGGDSVARDGKACDELRTPPAGSPVLQRPKCGSVSRRLRRSLALRR